MWSGRLRSSCGARVRWRKRVRVSNQLAYAKQVDAFAAAVEGTGKFPVPGEEGWQNQLILDAAYRELEKRPRGRSWARELKISCQFSVGSCQLLIVDQRLRWFLRVNAFRLHDRPMPFLIVARSRVQGFVENGRGRRRG